MEQVWPALSDEDVAQRFSGSADDEDVRMIGSYIETIAVLARRGRLRNACEESEIIRL